MEKLALFDATDVDRLVKDVDRLAKDVAVQYATANAGIDSSVA